ncbi:MAG: ATP-binding protein [Clostridia bacterium]|nr:ATP-binding protein [Clostridia bacterium]
MPSCKITMNSTFEDVDKTVEQVLVFVNKRCGISDHHIEFITNFVLRELLNNAVEHGNGLTEEKKVTCEVSYVDKMLHLDIADEGSGFDIREILERQSQEAIDGTRGRGIEMIRRIGFVLDSAGNHITAHLNMDSMKK